jgi:hypothetical protein
MTQIVEALTEINLVRASTICNAVIMCSRTGNAAVWAASENGIIYLHAWSENMRRKMGKNAPMGSYLLRPAFASGVTRFRVLQAIFQRFRAARLTTTST